MGIRSMLLLFSGFFILSLSERDQSPPIRPSRSRRHAGRSSVASPSVPSPPTVCSSPGLVGVKRQCCDATRATLHAPGLISFEENAKILGNKSHSSGVAWLSKTILRLLSSHWRKPVSRAIKFDPHWWPMDRGFHRNDKCVGEYTGQVPKFVRPALVRSSGRRDSLRRWSPGRVHRLSPRTEQCPALHNLDRHRPWQCSCRHGAPRQQT